MSLIMLAVGSCMVKALKGQTLAQDRVLQSDPTALEAKADGSLEAGPDGPFISVHVPDAVLNPQSTEQGIYANGIAEIYIETGVTAKMWHTDEDGKQVFEGVGFLPTSGNMVNLLGLLDRHIIDRLSADSQWADLLRQFFTGPAKVTRTGFISARGQRVSARQLKLSIPLVNEPQLDDLDEFFELRDAPLPEGETAKLPDVPFARFVWLLSTSENQQDRVLAEQIVGVLGGDLPEWAGLAQRMGFTRADMQAIAVGPADPDNPDTVFPDEGSALVESGAV